MGSHPGGEPGGVELGRRRRQASEASETRTSRLDCGALYLDVSCKCFLFGFWQPVVGTVFWKRSPLCSLWTLPPKENLSWHRALPLLHCCPQEIGGGDHSLKVGILEKPSLLSHCLKIPWQSPLVKMQEKFPRKWQDSCQLTLCRGSILLNPKISFVPNPLHHGPPSGLNQSPGSQVWLKSLPHPTSSNPTRQMSQESL